jgi:hypothetical protein
MSDCYIEPSGWPGAIKRPAGEIGYAPPRQVPERSRSMSPVVE